MNLDSRLLRRLGESRLALMMTIVLGTAAGVFTVMQAGYLSQVITRVFLGNQSLEQVVSTLVVLLGVIITRSVLAWVSEIWANSIAVRIKTQLRVELFERLLKLGPGYARGERTGELTNVLVEGVEALDIYYSQYLPQLVLAALVPLVYLFFVLRVDLLSGVILLLTAPLIPMFMVLIGNMAQAQTRKQWKALSRMSAYFLDVLQGLTTLKRLGRSRAQVKVIAQVSDGYCSTTMSVLRITFLSALVLEMVATLSTAVVAVEIGLRLLYGRLVFEEALFVLLLAPEFYLPLRLLGTRFHAGMAGVAAAKRIFEILETPADTGVEGQTENKKRRKTEDGSSQEFDERRGEQSFADQPEVMGDLRFDEVHYKYGDERAALNGVAFTIDVGQKVALVGPSGAGKSTIAGLLLHFFYPSEGKILVGGKSLTSIDAVEWRTQVAWISQDPTLFYGTLVDNIRLARPDASMKDIVQAAKQAQAHEFIENQPLGYDTVIGERGARLSAGQVQRIALARAFLKDAPLLILDEPTVNLDPETEASLQSAMDELLVGRTALIIAHRLNTTINADKILVLDGGQIVEQGSHSELSRQGGLYSRLIASAGEPAAGSDSHSTKRAAPADVERETVAALEPRAARAAFRPPIQPPANSLYPVYSSPSFLRASRFSTFRRLVSLVNPFKGQVALSVLLGFCTVVCGIGLLGTSAYLISAAALQPSIAELQVAIVGVRFFGISRGLFRYLERLVSHQVTFRLLANLRVWFYRALEPLAPARLMSYRSGDLLSRIQDDTESLQNFYVRVLAPPLVAILVALVMGLFLSHFDRSLAMVLLIFFLLVGVGLPLFIQTISRTSGRRVVMLRGALNAALVEGVQGMGDLLVYGQEARRIGEVEALSKQLGEAQKRFARVGSLQNSQGLLLANLCMWVLLVLAIPLVESGQMSGVYLAVVVLAALTSFEAVLPLPQAAQYLENNLAAAERLHEIVDAEPEVRDRSSPLPIPETLDLEVDDLCFHYPLPPSYSPDDHYQGSVEEPGDVLVKVNFRLPQGKSIAVVGPSGAGKSTLINLLLRFWEYRQGRIVLDGEDLQMYDSYEIRDQAAVVAQDSYLFNTTVRENLLVAQPEASEDEMVKATKQARIHEFIESLPQGYDTYIGERGTRLSGGERQRLVLARAFLRDAPLLLFDEATAKLDAITESEVLHIIKRLVEGRSGLIVTHRLVGLETIDEIIVLREGAIVERGTHQRLMSRGGYYRKMWDLQHQELLEQ